MNPIAYRLPRLATLLCCLLAPLLLSAGRIELDRTRRDQLKKETVYAIDHIQSYHYKQKRFADLDPVELLNSYMEDLDGGKLFFLAEDVDFIVERFRDTLKPAYLYIGDLYPAFEIFNSYYDRVNERLDWIATRLSQPFDLDSDRTFVPDRKDAPWPADRATADDLWERRLIYEIIAELLADQTREQAIEKISRRYERTRRFVDEIEVHNVQESFLTSLAQLYDPHSSFMSWDSAAEFNIALANALIGIGAQLRDVDGLCVIESLVPGGPAEMSGQLHPGDKIVAVAQGAAEPVDVVGMKLRRIVQQIRGEAGTEVRLTIIPADATTPRIVALNREKIELTANLASALLFDVPEHGGKADLRVGVIHLPSFYGEGEIGEGNMSTTRDVEELINQLKAREIDALVLDLRDNGGGRLDEAVNLTGLFLPEAPVVMKRSFNGRVEVDWDRKPALAWDGPLVVLVSRASASASEIVAGALQSHGRAIIVGDTATHGKGTVQAPIDLRDAMQRRPGTPPVNAGTVKITIQQFFLPNGESTQNRGVLADIALPSINSIIQRGESELKNALAWDVIPAVEFKPPEGANGFGMVSPELIAELAERSARRMDTLDEFDFLRRQLDWYRDRHERKEWSLNLAVRRAERTELEARRDAFEQERRQLSAGERFPSVQVDLAVTVRRDEAHQQKLHNTPLPDGSPRAGQVYQKVYYHADADDIREVWIEYIDYEKLLPNSAELATQLTAALGAEVTGETMHGILNRLRNADRGGNFNVLDPFREILADAYDEAAITAYLPEFFASLVRINPDILRDSPRLDIHLNESLRIVVDWIAINQPGSADALIAARGKVTEPEPVRTP
jgi:carboxyl-terminal processing protease